MPALVDGVPAEYGYGGVINAGAIVTGGTLYPGGSQPGSLGAEVIRCNPAGAVTGIILALGNRVNQQVWVVNESANSITFAAQATSNVADGAGAAIAANTARLFKWDVGTNLWYRAA